MTNNMPIDSFTKESRIQELHDLGYTFFKVNKVFVRTFVPWHGLSVKLSEVNKLTDEEYKMKIDLLTKKIRNNEKES